MTKSEVLVRLRSLHEGSYTRKILDRLGDRALDKLAEFISSDSNFEIKKFFDTQKELQEFEKIELQLRQMAEDRTSADLNGQQIDGFSAYMVSKVLDTLDLSQKKALLSRPTNEIVAIAYKLASRTEFSDG